MPTPAQQPAPAAETSDRGDEIALEIGRLLRRRRLRRGEDLRLAAGDLGVEPDCLERLEQGGFDSRAVPPYTAALLRAHADRLGLDGRALAAVLTVRASAPAAPPGSAVAELADAAGALLRDAARPLAGRVARVALVLAGTARGRALGRGREGDESPRDQGRARHPWRVAGGVRLTTPAEDASVAE